MQGRQRDKGLSMRFNIAVLAALFTYVEFIPVTTVNECATALMSAIGVGVIIYSGLNHM